MLLYFTFLMRKNTQRKIKMSQINLEEHKEKC